MIEKDKSLVTDLVLKKDEQTDTYKYNQTHDLSFPKENSGHIVCSKKDLKRANKYLKDIKEEAKKSTSLWIDLCSTIFGVSLSCLVNFMIDKKIYSFEGFWVLAVFFVSFSRWLWLKRRPGINISEKIDNILELLPNTEEIKTEEDKEK